MTDLFTGHCGCEDCEAAVSPGAYLTTLLDYVLKHVRNNGAKIELAFLEERFHQPFTDLPMDCDAMNNKVHQVRIAVNILRSYLGARPLPQPAREASLLVAEADYRLIAYLRLLTLLGTTYEEVRRARSSPAGDRTTLAERLGISLTPALAVPRLDELDLLFLNASLPATNARALTERSLERIFGLGDTERDSLSEGVKFGDTQQQIARWNVKGAYWGLNTDVNGLLYLDLFKLAADSYAVRAFSNAARTLLVASGESKTPIGTLRLIPESGSGLSGVIEIHYVADETDIALSMIPLMSAWRVRHLRSLWNREDWPVPAASPNASQPLLPLIDPQVISLNNLRNARPTDPSFDLWLARFNWLSAQRTALKTTREAALTQQAGMEAIIAQALSSPGHPVTVADLDTLDDAQKLGERIEQRLGQLSLSPGAFGFLMPLLGLTRAGEPVVDVEWDIIYDTFLRALKQLQFPAWRAQEQGVGLTLSPSHFAVGQNATAPAQATSLSQPFWLSTREVRRNWVDVLEARIAQESAILAGLEGAVGSVEETALPLLRDALVKASDAEANSPQEAAEWLTARLLIDFRMSGLQLTTHLAQAIETLQELLFSLRTGQLQQDAIPTFAPLESISAAALGTARIDLFGRSADDRLWHRIWDGRWHSWRSLGPLPGSGLSFRPSDPAVVARGGGLDVLARGGDRVLWHRRFEQEWSEWSRVEDDLELVGNPAIALRGSTEIDVYASRIGDLQVMQRHYDGVNWTGWVPTGATTTRAPAAAGAVGRVDLILARNSPGLFKPLHRWRDGLTWQEEPLDSLLSSNPAAVSWGVNRLDVFQNSSGHLWQKVWNGAWQPWVDLDAALPFESPTLRAAPAAYSNALATLDVFALRGVKSPASVWRRQFAAGAWQNWAELPSDQLDLDAPDFDTEWGWVGSYSTFRSAMFVRIYPDNLLTPSLIAQQTPAFQELVKQTRPIRRLTPAEACGNAHKYSDYLRDISSLSIGATCQVSTTVATNTPCKMATTANKTLFFMFGKTSSGDKIYWSSIDPVDRSGYAHSFWANVALGPKEGKAPPIKILNIVGALPWLNRPLGKHHIYLFLDTTGVAGRKLQFARLDLDQFEASSDWVAELNTLEVGDVPTFWDLEYLKTGKAPTFPHVYLDVNLLTFVPVQSNSVSEPPRIAIQERWTRNIYHRPLSVTGDEWEAASGWTSFLITPRYTDSTFLPADPHVGALRAALRMNGVNWVLYRSGQSLRAFADVPGHSGSDVCEPGEFRGVLPGSQIGSSIFVFYDDWGQNTYREVRKGSGAGVYWAEVRTPFLAASSLSTLARHSGSYANVMTYFAVAGQGGHSYAYRCSGVAGELIGTKKLDVVPVLGSTFGIPTGEPAKALQGRRTQIEKVYLDNKGASGSILAVLAEAYRLVPLQLGLNMQSSGEYVAALDWFLTVYDYRAAQGSRYIDYGLAIDAGLPGTSIYHHPEDWLLHPLNPHAIALTRRYAYTRFTITSIIRCLNDFADSEFTYDTPESLVRARLLYTTALELCDVPELRQHVGNCDALLGALEIQPGVSLPPEMTAALGEIVDQLTLGKVTTAPEGLITLEKMRALVQSDKGWATILPALKVLSAAVLKTVPVPLKTGAVSAARPALLAQTHRGLLSDPAIERAAKLAGEMAVAAAGMAEFKETV